ncbi:hypothetical protein [Streptomyces althioticus]|uniref:hypothetical protein n=1 Tax=Streptomyces althioticus TaxID=83380 RepID=UPI0033ACFD60
MGTTVPAAVWRTMSSEKTSRGLTVAWDLAAAPDAVRAGVEGAGVAVPEAAGAEAGDDAQVAVAGDDMGGETVAAGPVGVVTLGAGDSVGVPGRGDAVLRGLACAGPYLAQAAFVDGGQLNFPADAAAVGSFDDRRPAESDGAMQLRRQESADA